MEENIKIAGQSLETLGEQIDLDEELEKVTNDIKKYKCYSVAVWAACVITFVIKFIVW